MCSVGIASQSCASVLEAGCTLLMVKSLILLHGDPSGECEKFQLSSRHLGLLANLSKSNEQSNSFWGPCWSGQCFGHLGAMM